MFPVQTTRRLLTIVTSLCAQMTTLASYRRGMEATYSDVIVKHFRLHLIAIHGWNRLERSSRVPVYPLVPQESTVSQNASAAKVATKFHSLNGLKSERWARMSLPAAKLHASGIFTKCESDRNPELTVESKQRSPKRNGNKHLFTMVNNSSRNLVFRWWRLSGFYRKSCSSSSKLRKVSNRV